MQKDIINYFRPYLPTLQKYLLFEQDNRSKFVQNTTDFHQRQVISILTSEYFPDIQDKMKALDIPRSVQSKLIQSKIFRSLRQGSINSLTVNDKQKIFQILKNTYTDQSTFICMRPDKPQQKVQDKSKKQIDNIYCLQNDLKVFLKSKLKQNSKNIQKFDEQAWLNLQKQDYLKLNQDNLEVLFNMKNIIHKFQVQLLLQIVKKYQGVKLSKNNKFLLRSCNFFANFTKEQLNYLTENLFDLLLDPKLVCLWFNLNYCQQLADLKINSNKLQSSQKKQRLNSNKVKIIKIINQLKAKSNPFLKSFVKKLQFQLLMYDCETEQIEITKFIDYLNNLNSSYPFFEQNFRKRIIQKKKHIKLQDDVMLSFQILSDNVKKQQLIQRYLKLLIQLQLSQNKNQLIQRLSQYFSTEYLSQTLAIIRLKNGQQVQCLYDIFVKQDIQAVRETKKLIITSKNKKTWSTNQDIYLNVEIKKMQQIQVNIYEVNAEKQLLFQKKEINEQISLNDVQPNMKYIHKTKLLSDFHQMEQKILVDLPKKHGIYIVDFIADQMTSRAVIRRGAIIAFTRECLLGYQVYFYDHEGQIIQVKIWMEQKQFYSKQGKFLIPFPQSRKTLNLICVLDDYAQIVTVNAYPQKYQFKFECIYNNQSFMVGNKAQVIVHSSLMLSQSSMPASLLLLKDVCITINMKNHLLIPSSLKYENVKFQDGEDYLLQFPIQTYMSSISIQISGRINSSTLSDQNNNISAKKQILIALDKETNFRDLYLREQLSQDQKQPIHILSLLGLNGQPIPNATLSITFDLIGYNTKTDKLKTQLKTDTFGNVCLKQLTPLCRSISVMYVSSDSSVINKQWPITGNGDNCSHLQTSITRLEGQPIQVSYCSKPSLKNVSLIQVKFLNLITNKDCYLEFNTQQKKIVLKNNLPKGQYKLLFHSNPLKNISISIVAGKQWPNYGNKKVLYDQSQKSLYQITQNDNKLTSIGQILIVHSQQQKSYKIQIPIININKQNEQYLRAHAVFTTFAHQNCTNLQKFQMPQKISTNTFKIKKSSYLNNKILSDQTAYILNRKKTTGKIGSNLQKPGIFMKRLQVRLTDQTKEKLQTGKKFDQNSGSDQSSSDSDKESALKDKKKKKKKQKPQINNQRIEVDSYYNRHMPSLSSPVQLSKNKFSSHINFLQAPSLLITNIKQSKIQLSLPQNTHYTHVTIYLSTPTKIIKKQFDLNILNTQIKRKQIIHTGLSECSEGTSWGLTRNVYKLYKGEKIILNRDCQWKAIALGQILQFAKNKQLKFEQWQIQILKWKSLSLQQKLQFYNKNICHQLNSYIYFKDQEFFKKIIKPFIQSKIRKTFVDCCLLGYTQVYDFANIQGYKTLNEFQKVLLINSLVKSGKLQDARDILQAMKTITEQTTIPIDSFNKYFEWIIAKKQQPKPKAVVYTSSQVAGDARYCDTRSDQRQRGITTQSMQYSWQQRANINKNKQRLQQMKKKRTEKCLMTNQENLNQKPKLVRQFVQVQKTKQYTEVNYFGVKYPNVQSIRLASANVFWTQLAQHLLNNSKSQFLTDKFMHLSKPVQFMLAACFLSDNFLPNYNMKSCEGKLEIQAESNFLIFVKQMKQLRLNENFGIMMNQRFIDPKNKTKTVSNGLSIEKQVEQFVTLRPYTLQTIVSNLSNSVIPLQLLLDIPKGSIPLDSYDYTVIKSVSVNFYSTQKFERQFYYPAQCKFSFYQSNASFGNQIVSTTKISQCQKNLKIVKVKTIKAMQNFSQVLSQGTQSQIISFLQKKNLFSTGQFQPSIIMWMLSDKKNYQKIIKLFRKQKYYNQKIWAFSFLHQDVQAIKEYLKLQYNCYMPEMTKYRLPYFQYYPYNSSRCHKFQDQGKSTIRNVQFKQTYQSFVIANTLQNQTNDAQANLVFSYYLILQDRIIQAELLLSRILQKDKMKYPLQFDYISCFLDMHRGQPNYSVCREICKKYLNYPILSWAKMFKSISQTLQSYDKDDFIEIDECSSKTIQYATICRKQNQHLYLSIPKNTKVQIEMYIINFQLFCSQLNFSPQNRKNYINMKPIEIISLGGQQSLQTKVFKPQNLQMKNVLLEVYQTKTKLEQKVLPKKIGRFNLGDPKIQTKLDQSLGQIQIFYDGIKKAGCYCKIYAKYSKSVDDAKFYRDGYSDVAGKLNYALTQISKVTQFVILVIMETGLGKIVKAKPPNLSGKY